MSKFNINLYSGYENHVCSVLSFKQIESDTINISPLYCNILLIRTSLCSHHEINIFYLMFHNKIHPLVSNNWCINCSSKK